MTVILVAIAGYCALCLFDRYLRRPVRTIGGEFHRCREVDALMFVERDRRCCYCGRRPR